MASSLLVRVGARLDDLKKGLSQAERDLRKFSAKMERIGSDLTTRVSLPIAAIGTAAVQQFAKFERLELSLKALAEEGENTAETMARLQEIARLPGIGLEQAIQGSAQLRTVGFSALQAEEALKAFAKATTLSGGGPEQLQSVVRQITQINSKGRILQEDIGVILENVPSIGIALQDAFGTTNVEAIRDTGISTQQFTAEIIKAISANEKFQKAQGGVANELENFGLAVRLSLAELGRTIVQSINLSGILQQLSGFIQRVTEGFKALSPETQKFIVIAAGIAAAIGPVLLGLSTFIKVAAGVVTAIRLIGGALTILTANPIGAAIVAIGFLVTAFKLAYDGSERFRATIKGIIAVIVNFAKTAKQALAAPIKAIAAALRGDFDGAVQALRDGLGTSAGQSAGEAFSEAYNAEIARTIATRQAEQLNRGGAVPGVTAPTDLNAVFAGLPTGAAGGLSDDDRVKKLKAEREAIALNVSSLQEVIKTERELQQIRDGAFGNYVAPVQQVNSLMAENIGLTAELAKGTEELGLTIQESVRERLTTFERFADIIGGGLVTGIESLGNSFTQLAEQGALSFKTLSRALRQAVGDMIGALIKLGVARAIEGALSKSAVLGPFAIPIAAAAGTAASALFKAAIAAIAPPKLAQGGIIPPGFEGDRFPAMLNSGEAVIPLKKLFNVLEGRGGQGEFILRGQDLYLAMNRAERAYNRTGG